MSFNLKDRIETLYEEWLMECHPEEIRNKDDLINKSSNGFLWSEFIKEIIGSESYIKLRRFKGITKKNGGAKNDY